MLYPQPQRHNAASLRALLCVFSCFGVRLSKQCEAWRTCSVQCVSIISGVKIGGDRSLCWGPIVALLSSKPHAHPLHSNAIRCSALLHCALLYCALLHCALWHYALLHCGTICAHHNAVCRYCNTHPLYSTAMRCNTLYIQHCIILHLRQLLA